MLCLPFWAPLHQCVWPLSAELLVFPLCSLRFNASGSETAWNFQCPAVKSVPGLQLW